VALQVGRLTSASIARRKNTFSTILLTTEWSPDKISSVLFCSILLSHWKGCRCKWYTSCYLSGTVVSEFSGFCDKHPD